MGTFRQCLNHADLQQSEQNGRNEEKDQSTLGTAVEWQGRQGGHARSGAELEAH